MKEYISVKEVAKMFGVSDKSVYHWVSMGWLPAKRVSVGKIAVAIDDIEDFAVRQGIECINGKVTA